MSKRSPEVDKYIGSFISPTKERLTQLRDLIHTELPNAEERISYQMPCFFIGTKALFYIGGFSEHVSLFPGRIGTEEEIRLLGKYFSGKSTAKFPNDEDLPLELIKQFIILRLRPNAPM